MSNHILEPLFNPRSIAIFGASNRENSVGGQVLQNVLKSGYEGTVLPINPKHEELLGLKAFPDLKATETTPDLAVIATPAPTVPNILQQCGQSGVRSAVILTAGFREVGNAGKRLEQQVLDIAHTYGIRFIGPNCVGIMSPHIGLNATFSRNQGIPGNIALVSQSGAICTAILDWAEANSIGFSRVISTGIAADTDFGEVLDYLVQDTKTDSILLYIEGLHESRNFMSALRKASRVKPVIAIKAGRHAAGSKAAMSHTGALVGMDDVFDAALRRAGVVRVLTTTQLFDAARILTSRRRAHGGRLAIITNAGGPGVLATDLAADRHIEMAELSQQTLDRLNEVLPATWPKANPIDIIGDAGPDRYRQALEICLEAPEIDGVLVVLTPQAMTDPHTVAEAMVQLDPKKPLITCWMGESLVESSRDLFSKHHIPTYTSPEAAIEAFSYLATHHANQKLLRQTAEAMPLEETPDVERAQMIIEGALQERRKVLTEMESKALLSAFRIPITPTMTAHSAQEALLLASELGFPVVLKVHSQEISHKSDVGGVKLNLKTAQEVRSAYNEILENVKRFRPEAKIDGVSVQPMAMLPHTRELMIGVLRDDVFGPVISFGGGGTAVEVFRDRAVSLPPLNQKLAEDLIAQTKVARMLKQFRNFPEADVETLKQVLCRVSEMVCELPWIEEMDINPLMLGSDGVRAVDARVVVRSFVESHRYSHMAIHPYPAHYAKDWQLTDGTLVHIRPIRPEDAELEREFVNSLSEQAKLFRFGQTFKQISASMLERFTQIDYDTEMAFIALIRNGKEVEIGVVRYIIQPDGRSCEFGLAIADEWQGRGVGHKLMSELMAAAKERGLQHMIGEVRSDNYPMLKLMESLEFSIRNHPEDPAIRLVERQVSRG